MAETEALNLNSRTGDFLRKSGLRLGARVLDLGTGAGDVAMLAAEIVGSEGHVTSIDCNPAMLEMASKRLAERGVAPTLRQADLHNLPADLGAFDAIIGRRVLMYLREPGPVINSLAKHLNRHGIMAFEELELTMLPPPSPHLPLHAKVYGWLDTMLQSENVHRSMGSALSPLLRAAGLSTELVQVMTAVETEKVHQEMGWRLQMMSKRLVDAGVDASELVDLADLDEKLIAERAKTGAVFVSQVAFQCAARKA